LRGDTPYDTVLVVTDEGIYELSDDKSDVPAIATPLWMVHLGGKLSPAYDDATLRVIQDSRGGVSTTIPEVMQRLATQAALGQSTVSVVDGLRLVNGEAAARCIRTGKRQQHTVS
jgi:hypothetical protein